MGNEIQPGDQPGLQQAFEKETGLAIQQARGASLTTFCIGGLLNKLVEINSLKDACAARRFLHQHGQKSLVLGAGSNLLIADEGVETWVLKPGRGLRYREVSDNHFKVGAAMPLMVLSQKLSEEGFGGLEFAGGIPGSMGGALRMNAGAHGGQISDLVTEVLCVDKTGAEFRISASELTFSYRHCSLPADMLVLEVSLKLRACSAGESMQKRADCLAERKARQPLTLASAGSVFRNPAPDKPAGMLIERAGLKGTRRGGACVSQMHANWIVNEEKQASARDVIELIDLCREKVRSDAGIELQTEIVRWP